MYTLNWSRETLEQVLSERLKAFSNKQISRFQSICAKDVDYSVDRVICMLANKSPRNVIRICEKLFAYQAELDPHAKMLSAEAIDRGLLAYCDQIAHEIYGRDTIKELERVGRELFTINYLANDIFKVEANSVRNRITAWTKMGLVKQVGTITVATSRKPLNFYYVADPAVVRLIYRTSSLVDFIKNYWIVCNKCSTDNLFDINHFNEETEPTCVECGRKLF